MSLWWMTPARMRRWRSRAPLIAFKWKFIRRIAATAQIRRLVIGSRLPRAQTSLSWFIRTIRYTPKLIPPMAALIASGLYSCVLASRILGGGALSGGMPLWKYIANRCLTLVENLLIGAKLSEYHTGYRAFSRRLLERLPLDENSDDFVFDNQIVVQVIALGYAIGEVTCPARYLPEASSINFRRSVRYGLGCLGNCISVSPGPLGTRSSHRLIIGSSPILK